MVAPTRRGMTLVELLVAAAIGVGVFFMMYGSLAGSSRNFRAGESGLQANLAAQRIVEYLREDMAGPLLWGPCDLPREVLAFAKFPGASLDFSLLRRHHEIRVGYFTDSSGPQGAETDHLAGPGRARGGPTECPVTWSLLASVWVANGAQDRALEKLRAMPHRTEFVPGGDERKPVWVHGPGIWVYDAETQNVRRYAMKRDEEGVEVLHFVDFGEDRLEAFELMPISEFSRDAISTPPPGVVVVQRQKVYARVKMRFRRDADRAPLEFEHLITYRTPDT